ncbi:MAG: hypothetical protein HQM10_23830 [Candidatus Riflebacteria bacterium]|nr:hypothetical protein [Candidatus Riflebacteria bacterium]
MKRISLYLILTLFFVVFSSIVLAESEKNVGIFYDIWFNKIQSENSVPVFPEEISDNAFRYWGEPLLGKYRSDDNNVINVHARQLFNAGVDFIIIDLRHSMIGDDETMKMLTALLKVYVSRSKRKLPNPKIAFQTTANESEITKLYQEIYQKYDRRLFFMVEGKPLLLPTGKCSFAVTQNFTVRPTWGLLRHDDTERWSFMEVFPQRIFVRNGKPEQMSVSAGQQRDYMSNTGLAHGRKWDYRTNSNGSVEGKNFDDQWNRACKVGPKFVIVNRWNGWVEKNLKGAYTDNFNQEFSNDIEPMKGGHRSFYYKRLKFWIARYHGKKISIDSDTDNDQQDQHSTTSTKKTSEKNTNTSVISNKPIPPVTNNKDYSGSGRVSPLKSAQELKNKFGVVLVNPKAATLWDYKITPGTWNEEQVRNVEMLLEKLPTEFLISCKGIAVADRIDVPGGSVGGFSGDPFYILSSTTSNQRSCAYVCVHEIAHNYTMEQRPEVLEAWKNQFWINDNRPRTTPPTDYGCSNRFEDIAESVALYFVDGSSLKRKDPERYEFIRNRIMSGREY